MRKEGNGYIDISEKSSSFFKDPLLYCDASLLHEEFEARAESFDYQVRPTQNQYIKRGKIDHLAETQALALENAGEFLKFIRAGPQLIVRGFQFLIGRL